MNKSLKNTFYNIPIYALNEVAKSIKGGRFVTVDDKNRLVLHYTPLTSDIWLKNLIVANEQGKLINIDQSEDGKYWSIPNQFIKICNEIFSFTTKTETQKEESELGEQYLLVLLYNGILDGKFGKELKSQDKSLYWYEIKDGKITRKIKRRKRNIDNEDCIDDLFEPIEVLEEWTKYDDILTFIKHNGWMMEEEKAKKYSLKHIERTINNE